MIHVVLPDDHNDRSDNDHGGLPAAGGRRLAFYLAMEEWIARNLPPAEYFFTWVVAPSVICGRNQDMEAEVNMPYCRSHGISVYRRRSGGGCVYADLQNIMCSYITPATGVVTTFAGFTGRLAARLRRMGIDARATGRNDITVDGRKISGNAFYHIPGRSIVHGTMLYATDADNMLNAITPERAKLLSKRVQSVQSRIVTASQLLPDMTFEAFHAALLDGLCEERITLTADQVRQIEVLEQDYYRPEWLAGKSPRTKAGMRCGTAAERIEGCGGLRVTVVTDAAGVIDDITVRGDFFTLAFDLDGALLDRLRGCRAQEADLSRALRAVDVAQVIPGLDNDTLVKLTVRAAAATAAPAAANVEHS